MAMLTEAETAVIRQSRARVAAVVVARPDMAAIITRNNRRREKTRGDPAIADINALVLWIEVLEAGEREQAIARLVGCPRCPGVWMAPTPYRKKVVENRYE